VEDSTAGLHWQTRVAHISFMSRHPGEKSERCCLRLATLDSRVGTRHLTNCLRGAVWALGLFLVFFGCAPPVRATILWSDLGTAQVHETGAGADILGGILKRDDSSTDALYFKFHVDPVSDASTELYFAAFQLFEGDQEHIAVGNALRAFAYSAFATGQIGQSNQMVEYIDLKSSQPEPSGIGTFYPYELVHSGIERTIVFKVQYMAGGDDLVTVWLEPDLRPGATEANQSPSLTTQFTANASFNQIRLRHGGGGAGWIFSEMAIATSFDDFVNGTGSAAGGESPGLGQDEAHFTFRSWQREQGLPENYVRALAQTRDGYIWVGSDDGVSRFDGVNFFSLGLREGLQSEPVQVLFGDSRGALWIGSAGSGLNCWQDGKLSKFTMSDGLPSESITALAEDREGRIWVGTQAGLVILQDGHPVRLSGTEMFSGKPIATFFCDRSGAMWVGAIGAGVFSYKGDKFEQLRDKALDGLLQDPHCLLVDQRGLIWIGAGDAFVLCREGSQWRRLGIPRHLATHYISSLVEQPDGTVWAGSVGEGLLEFKAGKLVVVNASSGLSDNLVEALLMDREGKLWVGTHGGLNRICLEKVSVLSHSKGLDYGAVQGLAEVQPGVIWAAQPNGLYQWDGRMFRRLMLNGSSSQEPSTAVLLADRDGSCWAGGTRGLLHFKNPQTAEEAGGVAALTNLNISALGQDSKNGIWAGARDGELWHFADGKWQAQTNCPRGRAITAIVPDGDGILWVGTEGDGLYRFDGGAHFGSEKLPGLPSSWIRTLCLGAQDTLWIGTAGGGLSRLQNGHITTFTMREGLPDNMISQILEDDDGNLWLGNNRGIARIRKRDFDDLAAHKIPAVSPQVYSRADGMLSEECSGGFSPAGLKSKSGLLWFSTLKGIVVIAPHKIAGSPPPVVILEQMLVDGVVESLHPVQTGRDASSERETKESTTASLRIDPGKHILEFHYTGLSYDAPDRMRFRYRLEGLDMNWIEAGNRRAALYNSVPPGSYHFHVIACNGDGVWNETGASLGLTVLPYFWQTWWAISLAAVGLVAAVGRVVGAVEKRKHQRQLRELEQERARLEQERALERERTRIARDLHDEMGAKLCRISFLSEGARLGDQSSSDLQDQISSISDASREVLQSLDEIVWAVDPRNDTLEELASYIGQYVEEYFQKTGIKWEVDLPARPPRHPLSSHTRHDLFLAVREAFTNMLKHSGATRAKVCMTCLDSNIEIVVSDNGGGFDLVVIEARGDEEAANCGNGLRNMRQRMADIGGQCVVESSPGRGTTVRFLLPFDKLSSKELIS
jgi:ligand-binding sensor domain-containing protein/signal transduction histidine kinase